MSENILYCPQCGEKRLDSANFCVSCQYKFNTLGNTSYRMEHNQTTERDVKLSNKKIDGLSITGFVLGIVSIFIHPIWLIPLTGLILSLFGLEKQFSKEKNDRTVSMTWVGISLNGIYSIANLIYYSSQW